MLEHSHAWDKTLSIQSLCYGATYVLNKFS